MNVLVTGSKGQLGNELKLIAEKWTDYNFFFEDVDTLDITSATEVEAYLSEYFIDAVINGAAYTAVDKAESDSENAYKVNEVGVRVLAEACFKRGAFLLHVSTDYVFDGKGNIPYNEDAATNPQSVYGASKLAGEKAMLESGVTGAVVRTSWLYSTFGNNFVKTMLRLGSEREEIKVVGDQYGSPTYAADLAEVLIRLLQKHFKASSTSLRFARGSVTYLSTLPRPSLARLVSNTLKRFLGMEVYHRVEIYHYANSGICSWAEFAAEIMRLSDTQCKVTPITTAEYPTAAARPAYSVLDTSKIKCHLNIEIPTWQHSLKRMLLRK